MENEYPDLNASTEEVDQAIREIILQKVPTDGTSIGNKKLSQELSSEIKNRFGYHLHSDDYWRVRNLLIGEGKLATGRGKGGSVYLSFPTISEKNTAKYAGIKESELYKPFQKYLENLWAKDNLYKNYVCEIVAAQGKRETGGKWTRPDLVLVSVKTYEYFPGKILELITFEVKTQNGYGIESVFEAAAHSHFSHKSYLAINLPGSAKSVERPAEFDRIEKECKRFGIGLIIFDDKNDFDGYENILEAEWKSPEPSEVNRFIKTQLTTDNKTKISEMLR